MTLYWGAAVFFAVFAALGVITQKFFHFEGPVYYFVMSFLAALGVGTYAIFAYLQKKFMDRKAGKAAGNLAAAAGLKVDAAGGGGDGAKATDADVWVREANARLAQSRGGAGIANLPLIFVAGDRGTSKTSTILNSGLEPELLAGQVYQDNNVVSTRGANIFFGRDTVLVEAGGTLMAQPSNWKALVDKLKPGKLKSGALAPRGVILCFDLEAFTRQGAADAIGATARYLQERLSEISEVLGISFPIYVLFTRADRLPFFAEFVRNLTLDEAGQVVGATLPIRLSSGGVYAEEETQRLTEAFNVLFHSFCDQRLRLLPRETEYEKVPGAFEFPREFRKLRGMLTQFLVDIGKPSQLRASPFLRGFYFSGVRPVQVRDIPQPAAAPAAPQGPAEPSGATGMFRAGMLAERRAQQATAQAGDQGSGRRVPQWLFLGHLFNEVVLADSAARAASGASVKTSVPGRVLLATAAGLCLLYSGLLTMSFFGNKTLEDNAIMAAKNIPAGEAAGAALPSQDALQRLDTLRQSLNLLTDYHANGAPFGLRWGLYAGNSMLPHVRRVYYQKFAQLLFGSTQGKILAFLRQTPANPGPTDDFGYAYDSLKSYLLTTGEWKRSSDASLQTFLGSRLQDRWSAGREAEIGKDRADLSKLQFDFYGHDLHNGNPYSENGDDKAIDRTRLYLSRFSGIERVYKFLLAEGDKGHPPTSFNQQFPGTDAVVTDPVQVSWVFTKDGWKFMQDQLKKQNYDGEKWVLGDYQIQAVDKATMAAGILDRYSKNYIDQWRAVMKAGHVRPYANFSDASQKLTLLVGPSAPLLALFWWTSQNTGLDPPPGVADRFKAVHAVVPPSTLQQYIVGPNQNYTTGLTTLQAEVGRAASNDPDGLRNWPNAALSATGVTRQLAQNFPIDTEAKLHDVSLNLLLEPIKNLDDIGAGDLNAAGKGQCDAFSVLSKKYPLNRKGTVDLSLIELGEFLRPKSGKLWDTYEKKLKSVMTCENGKCMPKGNVSPAFVASEEGLMKFSIDLYGADGTEPNMTYKIRPLKTDQITEFVVTVNGQAAVKFKGGEEHAFQFPGAGAPSFKLDYTMAGGTTSGDIPPPSTWAVFRFFDSADTVEAAPGGYTYTWKGVQGADRRPIPVNGRQLEYKFIVDTDVFSKDFLARLKCEPKVTR